MKFLAWVMFLSSTVCFITVFCKQQWDVQIDASTAAFAQPSDSWRTALADSQKDDADEAPDERPAHWPTTRPAMASSANVASMASHSTVAAGDFGDAVK